jgi:hypothetical protein
MIKTHLTHDHKAKQSLPKHIPQARETRNNTER